MIYTCVRCGKQFEAKRKTAVCTDCHTAVCIVCGKEFILQHPYTQKTCSSTCRGIYRKESGLGVQAAQKSKETVKIRYGVENAGNVSKPTCKKICPICGKEFLPDTFRQVYCKKIHYRPCPVCGKPVQVKDISAEPSCCSEECRLKKTSQTCLEKYGSTCAVNSEHARQLAKETCLEKYGVEHQSQSKQFQDKFKATSISRYGTENPLQSNVIKSKLIATNNQRYGGNSPMSDKQVREKAAQTVADNFGGFGLSSPVIKAKVEATNLEKYGFKVPTQNPDIQKKVQETCTQKYGSPNYGQSYDGIVAKMSDPSKISDFLQFKDDPKKFIDERYNSRTVISTLCKDLGVTDTPIYKILLDHDCSDMVESKMSCIENDVLTILKNHNINAIHNTKKIITPLELDIYLPDYNFAIECNPTVTHNSSFLDPWSSRRMKPGYHLKKSKLAAAKGVQLFHLFGYEWNHKKDIMTSMILSRLGIFDRKVFARKTYVCEIADKDCKEFLDLNHQKGAGSFPIRYGLRIKGTNELVSVMTFNQMRKTIGIQDDSYELSRFCNLLNTTVIGGASKLFKHFVQDHPEVNSIVSYSDVAHTSGKLYEMLGFKQEVHSDPNYVWVDLRTDVAVNRLNTQKSNIKKFLKDETIDLTKTEKQIMMEHGYAQVFDSGTIRWRWTRS